MKFLLANLLRALANWLSPMATVTLGATTDLGAIVEAATAALNAGMTLFDFFNSPAMIAARQAVEAQKQRDLDAKAVLEAQKGDMTDLRERSS